MLQFFENIFEISYNILTMSTIVCSLSGSPATDPVISKKTGHIYQHSTILRHLSVSPTCPHTGIPLQASDLFHLSTSYKQAPITNPSFSNPSSLSKKIEQQYEALLLEAHMLKNLVKTSRQQLAHMLYRQDASQRVIAKLDDQVQANRKQIGKLIAQIRGKKMSE